MIQFIDLFDKQINEFVEILYLTEKSVVLSGEKYEKYIGVVPRTFYYEGELYISKKQASIYNLEACLVIVYLPSFLFTNPKINPRICGSIARPIMPYNIPVSTKATSGGKLISTVRYIA